MICLSRRSNVDPFFAMDVLAAANKKMKAGEPVISMAIGQPAASCPALVLEAAGRALKDGHIGYTDSLGLTALREKIAAYYEDHHKLAVSPERVAVTTGSSAAFNLAFLAFFDVGDRVAITRPGYPAYRHIMKALGLEVVEIDTGGSGLLDLKMLEETQSNAPLKGILFASPSNPTGASLKPEELKNIIEFCHEHNITVIADEIYHRLNFSAPDVTALSFGDDVTVINSFSKYYCMTGWRVGWMVLPDNVVRSVERISQNLYISAPEVSQIAAISAFDATSELEKIKDSYRINREHLTKTLPALGLKLLAPMDGAFYAYCDISKFSNDSTEFARKMLEETNVAATPGIDFDTLEGKRTMRFSYAGAPASIDEALVRLDKWLR